MAFANVNPDNSEFSPNRSLGASDTEYETQLAKQTVPQYYSRFSRFAGDVALAPLDLADTLASSKVFSWIPGAPQRGDLAQGTLHALNMPGLETFYNQNKGGIEVASGLLGTAGIIGADMLLPEFTMPATALRVMSKIPWVRRIATLDTEYANALNTVRNVDTALATKGAMGAEDFIGEAQVDAMRYAGKEGFKSETIKIGRDEAFKNLKQSAFITGAAKAAGQELLMGVSLNQNGFLYTDSEAQNIAFAAAGILGGGIFESMHAVYNARKWVNSDEIRRIQSSALDESGYESDRLKSVLNPTGAKPTSDAEGYLAGGTTDLITSYGVGAAKLEKESVQLATAEDTASLAYRKGQLAVQQKGWISTLLQKVTSKGVTTQGSTRFTLDAKGWWRHLTEMVDRDATAMTHVEMLGGVADDTTAQYLHDAHVARTDERIADYQRVLAKEDISREDSKAATRMIQRLNFEKTLVPHVAIDGEWMPLSEAAGIEGFQNPTVEFAGFDRDPNIKGPQDKHGIFTARPQGESSVAPITVGTDLQVHFPTGKSIDDAEHFDILRAYRAFNRAIDHMTSFKGPIPVSADANWMTLDAVEELLKRTNGQANVVWPMGMTRDSAKVEAIAQKAEGLEAWKLKAQVAETKAGAAGKDFDPASLTARLRVRYNLPKLTAYERGVLGTTEHPVDSLLRGIAAYGPDNIRGKSFDELVNTVVDYKKIGDIAPATAADFKTLTGNSFRYMLSADGKEELKPLIAYKRQFKPNEWTQADLADRMGAKKMQMMQVLTDPDAHPFVRALVQDRITSSDFLAMSDTRGLKETQIQGAFQNAPTNSPYGSLGKSGITSEMRDRDNVTNLGASRNLDAVVQYGKNFMSSLIRDTFGDSLNVIRGPKNNASLVLLNQFHSVTGGWDLAKEVATKTINNTDLHHFVLEQTERNQARWEAAYGNSLPKGQYLLNEAGKPVVLDDMALDLQQRFNIASEHDRQIKNTRLRAEGFGEIDKREWYVPPPNVEGKFIGWVMDPFGKTVPNKSIVAKTLSEFDAAKKDLLAYVGEKGLGYTFRTHDDVKEFANIWDDVARDLMSPSTTAIQPGKASRGVLSSATTNLTAWDDSLKTLQDSILSSTKDVSELLIKEQLNSAMARSAVAREVQANNPIGKPYVYRNIHDYYIENATGKSKLDEAASPVSRVLNGWEGAIDEYLKEPSVQFQQGARAAGERISKTWDSLTGWMNKPIPFSSSPAATKDFAALTKALGEYSPFKTSAEYLQAQHGVPVPWTSAGMSRDMSQFAAAMMLRVFEFAQPVMNMAGIVDAMPAVIRQMTPMKGETREAFATRMGRNADIFTTPNGDDFGILNMAKIGANGLRQALNPAMNPHYDRLVAKGMMTQEVAELLKQFSAIKSRNGLQKFFMGDDTIRNPKNVAEHLASKGVVGWSSVLSDGSENLSRAWAHMSGMEVGQMLGIKNINDLDSYAHDFANKMIANYSPQNRPEIFKGALGTPLGLFQAYSQNYYQRLFRYVETKDHQAMAWQLAMQGSLFGFTGMPGFSQFNSLMNFAEHRFGSKDPNKQTLDPESRIKNAFMSTDPEDPARGGVSELIAHGVISNIPTLFGAPPVDFATRGDVTARIPGASPLPSFAVVKKIWDGIGQAVDIFTQAHPALTKTQIAEVAANMLANRPMAGMIETWMSHGNDTDASGQLVSHSVGFMESTYRVLGLKSVRQAAETDAFYANKNAQAYEAAAMDRLSFASRAAIRENNPEAVGSAYKAYIDQGGDPAHFRRWFQDQYRSATMTRGQRQLWSAMHSGDMESAQRLIDAGVRVTADERTPDPQLMYGIAGQEENTYDPLNQPGGGLGDYPDQITTPQGKVKSSEPQNY